MLNKDVFPREDAEVLILAVNDTEDFEKDIWKLVELAYNLGKETTEAIQTAKENSYK